jgi:magnesium-transporting ATPase (P-type)
VGSNQTPAIVVCSVFSVLDSLNELFDSLIWQSMATTVPGSNGQALSTTNMWKMHQKGLENGLTELAVTGKAFNELCRIGRMQELLLYTRIFARFTPEDKVRSPQ